MVRRVYLAGPDVFLPEARDWAERRRAVCARHGLHAVTPLDPLPGEPGQWRAASEWRRIAWRNEAHIRSCEAMIANLTPFRGPGADAGTVYEVGFMRALGRPVFGYSHDGRDLLGRTAGARRAADGRWRDAEGLLVEDFGQFENLMIASCLAEPPVLGAGARWDDLAAFERCVAAACARLARG